jgi:molybdopterin-guanine dinucleotide biosynthesis protein A
MALELGGVAAVILAGGKAERLGGVNKALLDIGGRTLIERALDVAAECDPILVAVGAGDFLPPGGRGIPDLPTAYAGPLAGVAAAIEHLAVTSAQWLLSLAVDTPFFPTDFLARAAVLTPQSDCVMACYGAQDYPTNALWRLDALRGLPAGLRNGAAPHSLKRLANNLRTARLDYAALRRDDPFLNVNTPQDLTNLTLRAARIDAG